MSFSVEFCATAADAEKIVEQEHLPSEVKLFIRQALRAWAPLDEVSVKAMGHLYNNDYRHSNAAIEVREMPALRTPK